MPTILIIEDNTGISEALSLMLDLHQINSVVATSPQEGLSLMQQVVPDLIIQDMNFDQDSTSGHEGIELFHKLREVNPNIPIILLTAWTHLEHAVSLVKAGAADYLQKPWDDDKLITTIKNLLELSQHRKDRERRNQQLVDRRQKLAEKFDLCGIIYASDAMHEIITLATRIARSDVAVLITGPNGSGKQKIAELIQANSAVAEKAFITVNAGALPENLIEAEVFGLEAGAYTGADKARIGRFEAADGGTLFLDEIANLPLEGQKKLLRVLQTGEFERLGSNKTRHAKVRLISATNADLKQAVDSGQMREDLLYRINVIQLELPALKNRSADILPLAEFFIGDQHRFSKAAIQSLLDHDWPGNVRELENRVNRARLLTSSKVIEPVDLGLHEATPQSNEPSEQEIRRALESNRGVIAKTARALNLSRQSLYRRMQKLGIEYSE